MSACPPTDWEKELVFFSRYCFGRLIVKVMASFPGGGLIYGCLVVGWFDSYMIGNNHICAQNRYTFFTCFSYLYDIILCNSIFFASVVSYFPNV